MRAAQEPDVDVVILASHDSDLEPALEMAVDDGHAKIETAGWQGANVLRPKGRRRAGLGSSNKFGPITR